MGHLDYITYSLVFLISAIFVVTVFRRLKVSPVLGYLVAGILIGPSLLDIFSDSHSTSALAELGVVFLLFSIGLSLPFERLRALSRYVFGLGFTQVAVTAAAITLLAYFLGFPLTQGFIVGSTLALSSTAVVLQLLSESGELAARFGRVSFSILLAQDLAVVAFMIILPVLGSSSQSFVKIIPLALLKMAIVLATIFIVGHILLRPVFRVVAASETPEVFTGMTILVVFVTALATAKIGLSSELGAFIAGIILAGSEYRHQVEADIEPFRGLLLGLFFMTVGMSINFSLLVNFIGEVALIVIGMFIIKGSIILIIGPMYGVNFRSSLRVAFLLAAGGEFAFILLPTAVTLKIIPEVYSQVLYVSVALSMALTPLLGSLGKMLAEKMDPEFGVNLVAASKEIQDLNGHVIIGGYGRAGQLISKILTENLIPFVVVDMNMARVADGRARGLPVFYGDVRRLEVLRAVGAARAKAALIWGDHPNFSTRVLHLIKRHFSNITVCIRARDTEQAEKLEQAGAMVVVPNLLEPILNMALAVLQSVGTPKEEAKQIIEAFRPLYKEEEKKPG